MFTQEILDKLHTAERLGFGANTLEKIFPEISRRNLAQVASRKEPGHKIRLIPSDLFTASDQENIRMRRIIMGFFLINYENIRAGDLKTRENPLIKKDFTWKDINPVLFDYFLKQENLTKEEFNKIRSSIIFPDLALVNLAHEITVRNFEETIKNNHLVYLKDESFNLALLYEQHLIFLDTCVCGKPVIFKNRDIRTKTGEYRRHYFHCPWCKNLQSKNFYGKLEMKLFKHPDWMGHNSEF